MIKRILIALISLFVFALAALWLLGGGIQDITAAVNHYSDPLKYGSVFEWFFRTGTSTGEDFQLPGAPSTYPTLSMPEGAATTSAGPTTVYTPGSDRAQGYQ